MLWKRIVTAVLLIVLVLVAVAYAPDWLLAVVFALIALLGAWEWAALAGWPAPSQRAIYVLATALGMAWLWTVLNSRPVELPMLVLALVWWAIALAWVVRYERSGAEPRLGPVRRAVIGWLLLVPTWAGLLMVHRMGPPLLLALFVIIWGADTAAYFAGRRWGRRRLAARVSPGKTLEGLAAALLATLVIALGIPLVLDAPVVDKPLFLVLCVVTMLFSVLGDLSESLFKRMVGVKDSGGLLPGHGGVLDRIDSLTAAAPIFALGLTVLRGGV